MNYKEFRDKYLGKRVDFDKVYGYQCVDLIIQYCSEVFWIKSPWVWNAITSTASWVNTTLNKEFVRIDYKVWVVPKEWDVVIWNKTSTNPYWHIWLVDFWSSDKELKVLEQNASTWNWSGIWQDAVRAKTKSYKDVICFFRHKSLNFNIQSFMNNYKEIFKKNFPNGSTIFSDLEWASKDLTTPEQVAYFIAIWLERLKNQIQESKK